jgi:Mrp family chromosome partitioning ATPase
MVRPVRKIKHRTPPPKTAAEAQPEEQEEITEAQPEEKEQEQPEEPAQKEERKETTMGRFQVGQKIHFRPSHAKELQLTGTIKSIDEKNPNSLVVTAQPGDNAKSIEVERDFGASAEDATEAE